MKGFLPPSSAGFVISAVAITLSSPVTPASFACQNTPNPKAFEVISPGEDQLLPNGMMVVKYGDNAAEHLRHVTVHRVVMVLAGRHTKLPELRDPRYRILETNGTLNPMTYIIVTNALYYGVGVDSLGFPKKAWIDSEEDGLNGNEHLAFQVTTEGSHRR